MYLRLYRLQKQLPHFTKNFTVEKRPAPVLVFLKPVLEKGDTAWLIGLDPTLTEVVTDKEIDKYVFRKMYPPSVDREENMDILSQFVFEGGRLTEFVLPESFAPFLTDEVFSEIFGPIEGAENDKRKGTEWDFTQLKVPIPTIEDMRSYLGEPYSEETTSTHTIWIYRYKQEGRAAQKHEVDEIWVRHTFWNYNSRLAFSENHLGRLWITVDLRDRKSSVKVQLKELTRVESWQGVPF